MRKTPQEIERLLTACGMVSRSSNYTHQAIREMVAKSIHQMPEEQKTALIRTLVFLLYENNNIKE